MALPQIDQPERASHELRYLTLSADETLSRSVSRWPLRQAWRTRPYA